MSQGAERALFGLLLEVESIETLMLEGFDSEFIPSAELRHIYEWAIQQFKASGGLSAPTKLMFDETDAHGHGGKKMGDLLAEYDIDLNVVPDETVQWVMEELRSRHLTKRTGEWTKALSEDITSAPSADRPRIFTNKVSELVGISLDLQSKRNQTELREFGSEILDAYEARKRIGDEFTGLHTGLAELDAHTNGVKDGELMVVAAPPKGSKSYMIARIALMEFLEGRTPVLYTLENSVEMMRDRIACLATGVHPSRFEQGLCSDAEEVAMREWVHDRLLDDSGQNKLWILSPDIGNRSAENMVTEAQIHGADSLLIDQLSFMEPADERAARYLQVRQIMHSLKTGISTGAHKMPCVLTHQINRDGIRTARKVGHLQMDDMADGSEVERTADWVIGMWQSDDGRLVHQFLLQILAARRRDIKNWNVHWDIDTGLMQILNEEFLV